MISPFECPICFEQYGNQAIPVTFPCGHSCCISHVTSLTACITCRAALPPIETMNPSYSLRDGSELYFSILDARRSQSSHQVALMDDARQKQLDDDERYARMLQEEYDRNTIPNQPPPHPPSSRPLSRQTTSTGPLAMTSFLSSLLDNSHLCIVCNKPATLRHHNSWYCGRDCQQRASLPPPRPIEATPVRSPRAKSTGVRAPVETNAGVRAPHQGVQKGCGHLCSVSSLPSCCACMDRRPVLPEGRYQQYVDGVGWRSTATRGCGYCPVCKY